jgi:hypothetical protein
MDATEVASRFSCNNEVPPDMCSWLSRSGAFTTAFRPPLLHHLRQTPTARRSDPTTALLNGRAVGDAGLSASARGAADSFESRYRTIEPRSLFAQFSNDITDIQCNPSPRK